MGKPKKETVRKLRGLMILDQMEDYTPLHKLHNLSNELIETVSKTKGEFYQFNLSSCIRQQNSLTAQFVSFSLANLANIFYPPPRFLQ